jgi:hypothetical protein
MARILIACEESQTITKTFRGAGHEAFSCDLLPCSGGHPEWHIHGDVTPHLKEDWDLMIAHPECTYLTVTGNKWFYHPDDKDMPVEERRPHPRFPNRREQREDAFDFFMLLANAPIDKIAIENPVGIVSTRWRKPDQIIQPYEFGDPHAKKTCLWLKNLPKLEPTNIVEPEYITYKSGKRMAKWYADAVKLPEAERKRLRSKTFQGIADAMVDQWGKLL